MSFLNIIYGILIIGAIIVFHEFGHFIVARKNGVNVTEFMVGMGPVMFEKKTKAGTRVTLRCIPFGGACVMQGDDKGIPQSGSDEEAEGEKEPLPEEGSFQSKNVWARIAIIFAGPFFNFILAFILAVIILLIAGVDRPTIKETMEGFPAEKAGLMAGDEVVKINGTSIKTSRDISLYMNDYKAGSDLEVTVNRNGEELTFTIVPEYSEEHGKYLMGITYNFARSSVNAWETITFGLHEVGYWVRLTVKSLGMLFTGKASINELSGPVGVVTVVSDTVEASREDGPLYVFLNLMQLSILLSANIGIMNLLPIPALDGGRLLFLLIEAVRGKPVDKTKEGYVHLAGIIFLLFLMVFVMFNDIRKLFV